MSSRVRCVSMVLGAFAVVLGLAGCGNEVPGAAQPQPPASASASQSSSADDSDGMKTPAAAVKSFVTKVVQQKYVEACEAAAPVSAPGQDPAVVCTSEQMTKSLTSLHDAWVKPGVTLPPEGKVETDGVSATGDSVTVPDTAIKLDGRTLHELELIGSTGDVSTFKLSLEVTKKDGAWYVSDWNIDL